VRLHNRDLTLIFVGCMDSGVGTNPSRGPHRLGAGLPLRCSCRLRNRLPGLCCIPQFDVEFESLGSGFFANGLPVPFMRKPAL